MSGSLKLKGQPELERRRREWATANPQLAQELEDMEAEAYYSCAAMNDFFISEDERAEMLDETQRIGAELDRFRLRHAYPR